MNSLNQLKQITNAKNFWKAFLIWILFDQRPIESVRKQHRVSNIFDSDLTKILSKALGVSSSVQDSPVLIWLWSDRHFLESIEEVGTGETLQEPWRSRSPLPRSAAQRWPWRSPGRAGAPPSPWPRSWPCRTTAICSRRAVPALWSRTSSAVRVAGISTQSSHRPRIADRPSCRTKTATRTIVIMTTPVYARMVSHISFNVIPLRYSLGNVCMKVGVGGT